MAIRGYYLGCPGWGVKTWVGRLFPTATRPTEFLERYAQVFNSVEGNTTFYALPEPATVERWRDQVPAEFRFCFKFPREVTHDRLLINCAAEVATFLDRVTPLGDKLGTLMLQLPPRFDGASLPRLRAFLAALPAGLTYAVELRHEVFFRPGPDEAAGLELLRERGVDLVTMDARGVHAGHSLALAGTERSPEHTGRKGLEAPDQRSEGPAEENVRGGWMKSSRLAEVRARKPRLPVLVRTTGERPIVRCVPHEQFDAARHFVEPWATQIARWIGEGKRPYFFMHAPDDTFAPENAYAFHAMVRQHLDVGELPPWPGGPRQLSLL